jgi:gamma-F420-2:alpha-L-glutamate ligase
VDLLFEETGGVADIVCEVNSNAHFKNIHTCTGVNVAEKIMEYIRNKLK